MDELERYWIEKINAQVAWAMEEAGLDLVSNPLEEGTVYEGRGVKVVVTISDRVPEPARVINILSIDLSSPGIITEL